MFEKQSTPVATTHNGILATATSILKGCGSLAILLLFLLAAVTNAHATAAATTTTLTSPAASSTYASGASVTLTATVAPTSGSSTVTGTVTFKNGSTSVGTCTLSSGSCSAATTTLPIGVASLTAAYTATASFAASTSSPATSVTITSTTATTLGASPTSTALGTAVTLTASVTPTAATGNVAFFDNGVSVGISALASGTATLAVTTLTVGAHANITATYAGNGVYLTSNSTAAPSVTIVTGTSTATALATSASTVAAGASETLTATVTPSAATGKVIFYDNGTTSLGSVTLATGSAALALTNLAVGAHSITANYVGDTTYDPSTSSPASSVTVTSATTTAVAATVNGAAIPAAGTAINSDVLLTATVTASSGSGVPAGSVNFYSGSILLANLLGTGTLNGSGKTTLMVSFPTAATYSILASYVGSSPYVTSNSAAASVKVVTGTASTTSLAVSAPTVAYGGSLTLTATVTAAATGSVAFYVGGSTLLGNGTITSGTATLTNASFSAPLPVGVNSITATYLGSATYQPSNASAKSVTVTTSTATTLNVSAGPYYYGNSVTLSVTVVPGQGSGTPTGSVTFKNGTTTIGTGTLTGGATSLSLSTLLVGSNSITAVYGGDSTNVTSTSNPKSVNVQETTTQVGVVASGPAAKSYNGASFSLTATVTAVAGGATISAGSVTFYDSSTLLGKVAVSAGTAALTITGTMLPAGKHYLIASYGGVFGGTGSAQFGSSISSSAQVTITNTQTITFTAPATPVTYGATPVTLSASSTSSLAVTFTASGACSVNGSTLTYIGAGACTVTASQAGNNSWVAATPVQQTVTVNPASLTITASSPAAIWIGAAVPTITGTYAGFVNAETKWTGLTARATCGTTYTTSSSAGTYPTSCSGAVGANYSITYPAGSLVANAPGSQTITFTPPASPVTYGASPVSLSASSTSSLAVAFAASGTCSVNGSTLTYTGAGACTVTASQPGNTSFQAATPVQQTVTVNQAPLTITASSPSAVAYGAAVPTITGTYAGFVNAETKWTGLTARATCTTTYTTSSDPGSYPTSCSGAVGVNYSITYPAGAFTVNKAAQTFSHWYNSTTVYGTPVTLSGVASSGLTIAYTVVSGPGSISNGTTLTPSAVGTIVVAANQSGNTNYAAATQVTKTVTVYQAPLVVTASSPSVTFGAAVPTITASYVGFVNSDSSVSLSTQPVCSTAYTPASHVASAAPTTYCYGAVDPNYSITYTSGTVTIGAATPTVTWPTTSGSYTYGTTLANIGLTGGSAVQPGTSNSVPGTFAFTTPTTTPGVSTTSASVTFSPTGPNSTDYIPVTTPILNYVAFSVIKATPVIASSLPTASSIPYNVALSPTSKLSGGSAHNPIATGTAVPGGFSWTTGSTVPSSVGSNPESVTFSPTDTANYNPATANVNVTVSKATPTVTLWPTATAINYGQALSVSSPWATDGTASVGGTFSWTNGSTVPSVGSNISESVTFTPTVNTYYTNATGTVKITVNALSAAIKTLPTASAITYGQALSSSTLSGGAGKVSGGTTVLPGRFTWTSPTTVPDVGGPSQSITFTPTNTNYAPVTTGTVSVTVNPATPTVSVWPSASSIAYGQTLANSNLGSGTASVAGSFGWTDSTIEPVPGTTSNSVTFTPNTVGGYTDYSNVISGVNVVDNPCGMQDSNADSTAMYVYNDSETPTPALPSSSPIAIDAEGTNVSAICAVNAGPTDTSVSPTVVTYPFITSGAASSYPGDSNSYGTNAAVLAFGTANSPGTGATITIADDGSGDPGSISTANDYSNGVFASMGGTVIIDDTVIGTSGNSAHALDATYGGTLTVGNVQAYTTGNNSAVIVAGDGGGNVTIDGGYYASSGSHSAGIRAAGTDSLVTVHDTQASTTISAQSGPAVVVDGGNSVSITSTGGGISLLGALGDDHGIFLYFNPSKTDATAGTSTFSMTGGSITYACDALTVDGNPCPVGSISNDQNSPATLFSVANTTATINLTDVIVTNTTPTDANANGTLLTAAALNSGTPGANGGNVTFNANGEALTGDVIVDSISTVNLNLAADTATVPSTLTGAINAAHNAGATVNLTLDATSTWIVADGPSYLTNLTNAGTGNIYCLDSEACSVYVNGALLPGIQ